MEGLLAVADFLFVPDGFLLMVSLLLLAFLGFLGFLLFISNTLLLVVLLLRALAIDGVLPVASTPADPVVTFRISNIGLANSRNYMSIADIGSRPQFIGLLDFRLRKTIRCPPLKVCKCL